MTSKGELVRAILFPKPIQFRFYTDLVQVATLFLIFGLGGMIYSMFTWIKNGVLNQQDEEIIELVTDNISDDSLLGYRSRSHS